MNRCRTVTMGASAAFILLAIACASAPETRAERRDAPRTSSKLYPVDEAYKNPSFASFRERLKDAVARQDTSFLLECISETIQLGPSKIPLEEWSMRFHMKSGQVDSMKARHGIAYLDSIDLGRTGKKLFVREWIDYRSPTVCPTIYSTPIWDRLAQILSLGGAFADDRLTVFRAPYVWPRWPSDGDYDYAIIDSNVVREPMKAYGEPDTAQCDTLSYDLVCRASYELVVGGEPETMVLVGTADGKWGYVPHEKLRNPVDFGLEFTFSKGAWRITRFSLYP